ncbi:MAG TPA: hypothetical protein VF676_12855 [Flavobacterium sp.]|jgi:hypothetical protein
MKIYFSCFLLLFCVLFSCQDDEPQREAEKVRDQKKKELVFASISKSWMFRTNPINAASQAMVSSWPAWRDFLRELGQKPQSSIGAFQKKARILSTRAAELPKQIPSRYDRPEMRSRISVLITKINELNLYINLNQIPDQKVVAIIASINAELTSLQLQMDEIERRSRIPIEEGESEMIRMLDTSRAVPTKPKTKLPAFEQSKIIR